MNFKIYLWKFLCFILNFFKKIKIKNKEYIYISKDTIIYSFSFYQNNNNTNIMEGRRKKNYNHPTKILRFITIFVF